ncbi:hypothetical protein ACF09H_03430 [Streptomyces sp. NPDC014983]|uniref:hypothetical protein n=1 Tax=Streptomyces sp. NPDC014983 TaxID=3364933 RepID=UPI0037013471
MRRHVWDFSGTLGLRRTTSHAPQALATGLGWAQSQVEVDHPGGSLTHFTIAATGKDGNYWFRMRWDNGQWTDWQVSCAVDPNGPYCP